MPYIVSKPPKRIKKLPSHAQAIWISTFNSAWKQYHRNEQKANAVAWAAVKKQYQKKGDKWVKIASENIPVKGSVWTTEYINNLPDSSFAYIMPGGEKDETGKTKPRSLRKLPYKDANGKIDWVHLRNAISRASQTKGIPATAIASIQKKLRAILEKQNKGASFPIPLDRLDFSEAKILSEIKVIPWGTRRHPRWGVVTTKEKEFDEFVKNFDNKVRKDLPITEGHSIGEEEKPAIGWLKKLVNKGRDGLWTVVEWTEKGKELLKAKAYKYFSPEFFTTYEDPETHKKYSNVLSGGALTNFPYFKEQEGVAVFSEFILGDKKMTIEEVLAKEVEDLTDDEKAFLKEHKDELTDEQTEEYKEVLTEGEKKEEEGKEVKKEEVKKDEPENKASEKVIQMSEAALRILEQNAQEGVKAMAELKKQKVDNYIQVMTFSEHNQSGPFLPKSSDGVAKFLLSLDEEQQKQFKEIMAELPKARLFSELGKDSGIPIKASEKFQQLVSEKMKANDKLEVRQAYEQVAAENPEIVKEMG